MNCKYCNKECKNLNSLRQHEIRCKHNPERLSIAKNFSNKGRRGSNQHTKAKERGEKFEVSLETRSKLSLATKKQSEAMWTDEQREKHSIAMKKAVLENPESYSKSNVSGRVKMYEYDGKTFKGTWELEVAKSLSVSCIEYTNDVTPIPYVFEGREHLYFPDFYIPSFDLYIEVKGYERDRDLAKYSSLSNLIVLREEDINRIKRGDSITEWLCKE